MLLFFAAGPSKYFKFKAREAGQFCVHSPLGLRSFLSPQLIPLWGKQAMEFVDKILKCVDCGNDFVFTAGEQIFFHDKQFKNDPKRCKQCKAKRATGSAGAVRSETKTVCSACGAETTVPFKPTQGRPVLCRQCFQQKRPPAAAVAQ